jgi:putative membrane protein
MIGLFVAALIYATGWWHYRSRLPGRYGAPQLCAFLAGLACLWVAIASPLDEAADISLSAHMVQHLVLLTIAPALLLLGDPLLPLLRGIPNALRRKVVSPLQWRALRGALRAITQPLATLLLSSATLWSWHSPALYQLALRVPAIHAVEHASFLVSGVLFWYPVVQPWPSRSRWPRSAMIPYLLAADVQNTLLAAVFTFSDRVLYPYYELHNRVTEASALNDQVLAGVIMWVPMSLVYLVPTVLIIVRLLSPATAHRRAATAPQGRATRTGEGIA